MNIFFNKQIGQKADGLEKNERGAMSWKQRACHVAKKGSSN